MPKANMKSIQLNVADVQLGVLEIMVLREAQKRVTETDPETGEQIVVQEARPALLRFKRCYRAVNEAGEVVRELPQREVKRDVSWDRIPEDIQKALGAIDRFTKNEARVEMGLMERKQKRGGA